jgi:DNA-binding winged helix-turn-helix (wHTH) protein/Tfp pilus assembly protein PilF
VLRLLIERHGELVSKSELLRTVWGRAVVTDGALGQCVIDARRALGDEAQKIIRTVPRRGYIFDLPVYESVDHPAASPASEEQREPRWLALRRNIPLVVLGAVLVVGAWGLWSNVSSPGAATGGESQVASVQQPAQGAEALERLLRGQFFYERRMPGDIERAQKHFEQSLELDPSLALAWEGLAGVYGVHMSTGALSLAEGLSRREHAVRRALSLGPNIAEVQVRAARHYFEIGDVERSQQHMRKAHALDPDNPTVLFDYAQSLAWEGRFEEAIPVFRRSVTLDPLSVVSRGGFTGYLLAAGRYDDARVEALKELELNPASKADIDLTLARILILEGDYLRARQAIVAWPEGDDRDEGLAMVEYELGAHAGAEAAVQRLVARSEASAALRLAEIYAHRGQSEQAFHWMRETRSRLGEDAWLSTEWASAWNLRFSPFLRPLHVDARWASVSAITPSPKKVVG